MARRFAISDHPDRDKIIRDIIKGEKSNREIARDYGLSHASIQRYINGKLMAQAAAAEEKQDIREGKAVLDRINEIIVRMEKLYDACDAYLRDPANPEKYDLFPRAWEFEVIYREEVPQGEKTKWVTRKQSLQQILEVIKNEGYEQPELYMKSEDPRKLIIQTAATIGKQLETIARIQGSIKDTINNTYTVNQYWVDFKGIILEAAQGHPDVLEKIKQKIAERLGGEDAKLFA
jgi:hypothetical protein